MNAKVKRKLYQVFSGVRRPTSHGVSTMWPDNDCLIGLEVEAEHIRYKYVNAENTVDPAYEGATTTGYPSTAMRFWGWEQVPDGSLGPGGREFRFSAPLKGAALENAITNFFDIVTFREAPRAGIHVHVDWTDCDDIDTLTTLLAILCGIEPAIFNMVGHGRKENTFCKPLSTLPQSQIAEVLQSGQFDVLRNKLHGCDVAAEASRYYGANFASLAKHGTVEFRYFPSLYDKDKVIMWVQLLMQLRAASFDPALTPTAVVDKMSTAAGIREFITERFADLIGFHHRMPDRGDFGFDVGARRYIFAGLPMLGRIRQRQPIELAVGRQRYAIQRNKERRHHVIRQALAQAGFEHIQPTFAVAAQHHVSHQARIAALIVGGHHHGFRNKRQPVDR